MRVPAHYELSKNAIEAGKHVFCEWPLGANTKEAEELAALARKKNVRTMAGLQAGVPRLSVHARADPARLRRTGAGGEHDADGQRRVDPAVGSHLAARCDPGGEHTDDYVRARARRHVHGGRRADRSVRDRRHAGAAVVRDRHEKYVDVTSPDNIMVQGRLSTAPSSTPILACIRTTAAAIVWRFTARKARCR